MFSPDFIPEKSLSVKNSHHNKENIKGIHFIDQIAPRKQKPSQSSSDLQYLLAELKVNSVKECVKEVRELREKSLLLEEVLNTIRKFEDIDNMEFSSI